MDRVRSLRTRIREYEWRLEEALAAGALNAALLYEAKIDALQERLDDLEETDPHEEYDVC